MTPQEKSVITGFCIVVFAGTLINIGLQKDLRLFDWFHTSQKKTLAAAININTARVEELLQVPGIGPKTAQYILEYRRIHGMFRSLEPLQGARGMSPQRYERLVQYLKI